MAVENHAWSQFSLFLWLRALGVVPHANCAVQPGGCDGGRSEEFSGFDACCVATLRGWDRGCEDIAGLGPDAEKPIVGCGEDARVGREWGLGPTSSWGR